MFERVVGVRNILLRLLFVHPFVMCIVVQFGVFFGSRRNGGLDRSRYRRLGRRRSGRLIALLAMIVVVVLMGMVVVFTVFMFVLMGVGLMTFIVMMLRGLVTLGMLAVMRMLVLDEGSCLGRLGVLDDLAPDAVAAAAAAGIAMARAPAAMTVLVLFLGLAMGALVGLDQGLTVGDRDLVIVGMDFAEGEEAVAVAAIFDEGRLQRRFYPRDLREVDIAAQLLALGGFEIKFFDAIAADHDDPGLFRVGGIDQHLVGHFGTLGGGGRVGPGAQDALSGDATVHLIRG
jgi:hypothetical protein